ncbi:MAG: hypothetical protein JWN71_304 [Xanthobacteraceae bacterium]|nr:hypothetical protein [Xanthobacteraceae bacterium]
MALRKWLPLVLAVLSAGFPTLAAAQDVPGTVPLNLYFSTARGDNFTTATAQGERDALAAGYGFARVEGYVFATPRPGTVPLKLYWSAARGDNFTTATAQGERDAKAAGYVYVRVEGYIYPSPQVGTVPLKLYWSDARRDNFSTATDIGEGHARAANYGFARIEGYVYPARTTSPSPPPLTSTALQPPVERAAPSPANPATVKPAAPVIAALPPASPSAAGKRVALVIGNSSYTTVAKLPNPQRDADSVGVALRSAGFQVTVAKDLTRERLIATLIGFAREAENADWGLVYYAGHGMEVGGVNYLIPVDARLSTDRDIELEGVPLNQVLGAVERARRLRLVLLDACRDNPFAAQMKRTMATRSVGRGLASVEPEAGTLVVYAAKHGETAMDGEGANSPFAAAFVKNIAAPGVEVRRLFDFVRDDVMETTRRQQQPFSYGSLPGRSDFYFVEK